MPDAPTSITATDADLVAAHVAGDRGALAAIYDRYANSLYDTAAAMTRNRHDAADVMQDVFVLAAERMGQLRDPERLRPWLFAILRNEVYRRSGTSRRTVSTDFTDSVAEMSLPSQPAVEADDVEFEQLAELVRAAAAGLDERDQLVLEYTIRQGLEGTDLADALGVSAQQCYGLVHRMRQRTERSLGALCVARTGRKDCAELAAILGDWNGEFSVLVRKRVARHVDRCATCERSRRMIAPFALFGTAPALLAPPDLRQRVLTAVGNAGVEPGYGFAEPGGFPTLVRYATRAAAWFTLTVVALLIAGVTTAYVLVNDGTDEFVSAAGAQTTTVPPITTTVAPPPTALPTGSPVPIVVAPPDSSTSTSAATTSSSAPATTSSSITLPAVTSSAAATIPPPTAPTATTSAPTPPPTTATTTSTTTASTTTTSTTTTTTTTTTAVPAPGQLRLAGGAIDFGTTTDSVSVTLSNTGGRSIDWSSTFGAVALRGAPSPFSVSPGSGTLAPGGSAEVIVSFDRNLTNEGTFGPKLLTFFAPGTSAQISVTGTAYRAPVFDKVSFTCGIGTTTAGTIAFQVTANVLDESLPLSGVVVLTRDAGVFATIAAPQIYSPGSPNDPDDPASVGATFDLDAALIDLGLDGVDDPFSWSLTVADVHGNSVETNGIVSSIDPSTGCSAAPGPL